MTDFESFRNNIIIELKTNKPKEWRDGQFVFNYIDTKYGVARYVQFVNHIDCFYNDNMIEPFIMASYERMLNI